MARKGAERRKGELKKVWKEMEKRLKSFAHDVEEIAKSEEIHKVLERTEKGIRGVAAVVARLAKKGEEEVVKASRIGRLRFDIVAIRARRDKRLKGIGAKAYQLQSKRKIQHKDLVKPCQEVEELEKEIKEKEKEIAKMKRRKAKA